MVAGPEVARVLMEFEEDQFTTSQKARKDNDRHHDQQPSVQKTFIADVRSLKAAIDELGNPFLEMS